MRERDSEREKNVESGQKLLEMNIACIACFAHGLGHAWSYVRILYPFLPIICPAVCTHLRLIYFHLNSIRLENVLCGSHTVCSTSTFTYHEWARIGIIFLRRYICEQKHTHLINHSIKNMFDFIERECVFFIPFRFKSNWISSTKID